MAMLNRLAYLFLSHRLKLGTIIKICNHGPKSGGKMLNYTFPYKELERCILDFSNINVKMTYMKIFSL